MSASDNGVRTTHCSYLKPRLIALRPMPGPGKPARDGEDSPLPADVLSEKAKMVQGWEREGKHILQSDLWGLLLKKTTMEMLQ